MGMGRHIEALIEDLVADLGQWCRLGWGRSRMAGRSPSPRRILALGLVTLLLVVGLQGHPVQAQAPRPSPDAGNAAELLPPDGAPLSQEGSPQDLLPPVPPGLPRRTMGQWQAPPAPEDLPLVLPSDRQQLLMAADAAWVAGDQAQAIALYQAAKGDRWPTDPAAVLPAPITDPAELPPAAAVYWREVAAGQAANLPLRVEVPLRLLVTEYPQFLPAQQLYSQQLIAQGRLQEAAALLDRALARYPSQPDLLQAQVSVLMAQERWLEASITARQFSLLNPDHPQREAAIALATENLNRFRGQINQQLTSNFLGNLLTGAASVLLTGSWFGPFTALNSAAVLLQGEAALGARIAQQARQQLPILQDPSLDQYLNSLGQRLATYGGRDEFAYEFHWIQSDELNAFALPGGKIFINTGALEKTESEAELAGLVAHEIAHAVLSHGFQMVTNGNLLGSLASLIPSRELANIAAGLAITGYSRQMEQQADGLGTQLLASSGYAPDGLYNLMVILQREVGDREGVQWFATHPAPRDRVAYLQALVHQGHRPFGYEGVATHLAMQERLAHLRQRDRHWADPQVRLPGSTPPETEPGAEPGTEPSPQSPTVSAQPSRDPTVENLENPSEALR